MARYIELDALLAEIERLRKEDGNPYFPSETADKYYARGVHFTCDGLVNFLDTLEVKETEDEPVSKDLEYASEKYSCRFSSSKYGHNKIKSAFKAGAKRQKEQMMKSAITAHCFGFLGFQDAAVFSFKLPADKYLVGSEVKVIVIKEG